MHPASPSRGNQWRSSKPTVLAMSDSALCKAIGEWSSEFKEQVAPEETGLAANRTFGVQANESRPAPNSGRSTAGETVSERIRLKL